MEAEADRLRVACDRARRDLLSTDLRQAGGRGQAVDLDRTRSRRATRAGGDAVVTTAVCADVTAFEPVVFVAVTLTRIVFPASAATSVYVLWVAVGIDTARGPVASQRDQRYANVMPEPVHVTRCSPSASRRPRSSRRSSAAAVFGGPT